MKRAVLFLILAMAALLRFGGLSHDLHEGRVYHPDTPKQVRAVERFLEGRYFIRTGISDYDGYPYFNAHLVEYLCRIFNPPRVAVLNLLGIPTRVETPAVMALFWITRLLNATLATLLVWLVYRLVREHYGDKAALVAALFLAFSPVDVTACHYANGDTTAAFFATLSLLFALRIARDGRWRDYLFAVFFAACGFASKYHAGIAALPILLAHAARYPSLKAFFSRASWSRLLACGIVGIAALFVTIPTLIHHTGQVTQDIVYFFTHVSKARRLPDEIQGTGLAGKFLFSMKRNGPILLYILGPIASVAALLALVRLGWRDRRIWVIGSLPVFYFLVGVSFRPIAPPVYHTLMTPMVFILAAILLTRRPPESARPLLRRAVPAAATLAILLSAGYLGRQALKETFFLWHMDTRRMASCWAEENVPDTFVFKHSLYTFQRPTPQGKPAGTVFVRNNIYPEDPPARFQPLKAFLLERDSLMQFRNPDILCHIGASTWITSPALMPVTQRWPSETGNQFVFDNGLTFLRDGKRLLLSPGLTLTRKLVTESPLEDAVLTVRNGHIPNSVNVSFGGHSWKLHLAPGATEALRIRNPERCFPRERGLFFYRLSADATTGDALVRLATRTEEIGSALFDAGRYTEAVSWLEDAAITTRNPTLAVQAMASRTLAPPAPTRKPAGPPAEIAAIAGRIRHVFNTASLEDIYGIGPTYLDSIPFLSIPDEALLRKGFKRRSSMRIMEEDEEETAVVLSRPDPKEKTIVSTPPLLLDPGHYKCSIRFRYLPVPEQDPVLHVAFTLPDGTPLLTRPLNLGDCPPEQLAEKTLSVCIPPGLPAVTIAITPASVAGLNISRISLAPDILATVLGWKNILDRLDGAPAMESAGEPMAFDVLLALGDRAAASNDTAMALENYSAAGKARPESLLPALRLAALRKESPPNSSWHEMAVEARFANGLRLEGALLRETRVPRGGSVGLNLYWDIEQPVRDLEALSVWVHFVDAKGKTRFQGDHALLDALPLTRNPTFVDTYFTTIAVPQDIPPGNYRITLGLYLPLLPERIRLSGSSIPADKTSLTLPGVITVL